LRESFEDSFELFEDMHQLTIDQFGDTSIPGHAPIKWNDQSPAYRLQFLGLRASKGPSKLRRHELRPP